MADGHRTFDFQLGDLRCWAMGHALSVPSVTLALRAGAITCDARLTPAEARAMAAALESAADHAEAGSIAA